MSYDDSLDALRTKLSASESTDTKLNLPVVKEAFQGWNQVEIFFLRELLWAEMQRRANTEFDSPVSRFRGFQLRGIEKQQCDVCRKHLYGHLWADIDESGAVINCSVKENKQ